MQNYYKLVDVNDCIEASITYSFQNNISDYCRRTIFIEKSISLDKYWMLIFSINSVIALGWNLTLEFICVYFY